MCIIVRYSRLQQCCPIFMFFHKGYQDKLSNSSSCDDELFVSGLLPDTYALPSESIFAHSSAMACAHWSPQNILTHHCIPYAQIGIAFDVCYPKDRERCMRGSSQMYSLFIGHCAQWYLPDPPPKPLIP